MSITESIAFDYGIAKALKGYQRILLKGDNVKSFKLSK